VWGDVTVVAHDGAAGTDGDVRLASVDFPVFFAAHQERVTRALTMTLGNRELARDAAAEGMARAYQRWGTVSGYDEPAAWVYRVGLNWARSRWRRVQREVLVGAVAERPTADLSPDEVRMQAALDQLAVDQRAVVVLRYYLDWSEARTAVALGIAPGTVKSRLSRALDRLAVLLADDRPPAQRPADPSRGGPDGAR
jgi:RNA polymerase sigma factor (sigma-70 family)